MITLIAAVGTSGSGKTTTLEYLISHLTEEGYRVGAIKHLHREGFTIDKEGTNTWRFTKAGSKITVAISPEEIAIIEKTKASLNDLDKVIKLLENEQLDIVFIEGFHGSISKRSDVLKLVSAKNSSDLDETIKQTVPPILAITGLVAKNKLYRNGIPVINMPDEGPQLLALVRKHLTTKQQLSKDQEN
jgi:molybdopterin-guanine dinucleotide biosynthesis protein MobB